MPARSQLVATDVEMGQRYYEGIDEGPSMDDQYAADLNGGLPDPEVIGLADRVIRKILPDVLIWMLSTLDPVIRRAQTRMSAMAVGVPRGLGAYA